MAEFRSDIEIAQACDKKLITEIAKEAGIEDVQKFIDDYETINVEGVSKEDLEKINELINQNVEFVEEDAEEQTAPQNAESEQASSEESEEYTCPECGAVITLDMTHCPKCGVEFEFKEDEE